MSSERRLAFALLGLLSAGFGVFAWFYLRRLNNYAMGDAEFTGWTAPFAARLAAGDRPYVDFVLPIPPGSFVLLAAIQKATHEVRLLQELTLIAVSHLAMALLAYAIAVPLTTRKNAVLIAAGTLVLVIQMPKECAYDHTAQLCVWSSLALGVRALLDDPSKGKWLWRATGLLSGACFAFKQSTATGVVSGWLLGFGYLALCTRSRELLNGAREWALGAGLGLAFTIAVVLGTGSSLGAYWQAVFVDGPRLKGGPATLLTNLGSYLVLTDAFPSGLLATLSLFWVGLRFARFEHHLHLGDVPARGELGPRAALALATCFVLAFALALAPLILELRELPQLVLGAALVTREVPKLGLALACVFFVGHHVSRRDAPEPVRWRGQVLNALLLVALASSLLHGLSFVNYYPFYNNDSLIPLALLCLFAALDRARLPWLKALVLVATFISLFGVKYGRALTADTPVAHGYWAGLRVNYRGRELLDAVHRVQQLTRPDERVLMLPEDAAIVPLFSRPRPPLHGAIVFVDQYPSRLADADIATLERDLPKVIAIHPQKRAQWQRLFSTWGKDSGAERVLVHVLDRVLPAHYRLDSTFRTIYFWDQGQFEIWVRQDG